MYDSPLTHVSVNSRPVDIYGTPCREWQAKSNFGFKWYHRTKNGCPTITNNQIHRTFLVVYYRQTPRATTITNFNLVWLLERHLLEKASKIWYHHDWNQIMIVQQSYDTSGGRSQNAFGLALWSLPAFCVRCPIVSSHACHKCVFFRHLRAV